MLTAASWHRLYSWCWLWQSAKPTGVDDDQRAAIVEAANRSHGRTLPEVIATVHHRPNGHYY
jgi:hypothetical protein